MRLNMRTWSIVREPLNLFKVAIYHMMKTGRRIGL